VPVEILRLPPGPPGPNGEPGKIGLDDFLLARGRDVFLGLFDTAEQFPGSRGDFDTYSRGANPEKLQCQTLPSIRGVSWREIQRAAKTAPICPRHAVPLLESRSSDRDAAILRVGCRRLNCPSCGPHRKKVWIEHLAAAIDGYSGQLYLWRGANGRPAALAAKKAQKCRADYCWVAGACETTLVTTVEIVASTILSHDIALETLASAIQCWRSGRRPIGSSRAWQLAERKRKPKRWHRRGEAPRGEFEETVKLVEGVGLTVQVREAGDGHTKMARVGLPAGYAHDFFFGLENSLPLPRPGKETA